VSAAGHETAAVAACRVCAQRVPALRAVKGAVAEAVAANTPGWSVEHGACAECVARFEAAIAYLRQHEGEWDPGQILPTPVRLGAQDRYRGRGVTIAFLDAGFFAHPDLVQPKDRIRRYVDVTGGRARRADLDRPDDASWHGMMTSVVACGNGRLSRGLYRGLASEARLVLVKVGTPRRIRHDDIARGLDWVLRNRRRHGIRVVNVSCGGDYEASYLTDELSQAAEALTRAGVLVCAAVGNQGHLPHHPVLPPASAPSVLAVGALDDRNRLAFAQYAMYHSSYGPTVDALQKPEVVAPGIWVAAPILPGTPTQAQAALLAGVPEVADDGLPALLARARGVDPELEALAGHPPLLRERARTKRAEGNVISAHYKHVDGSSFAAPIVASVAAQMIEANPALTPAHLRRLLVSTARRIPDMAPDRQGWGAVAPEKAVQAAVDARRRPGARDPHRPR
jgi:serine protease AprX